MHVADSLRQVHIASSHVLVPAHCFLHIIGLIVLGMSFDWSIVLRNILFVVHY